MEDFDLTEKISAKIDSCPNCGGKIAQTSGRMIHCPQCHLGIAVESGKTRRFNNYINIGLGCFAAGAITFLVIDLIQKIIIHV